MLSKIVFNRFTVFENLTINLSPGLNVFIGANGTGKTHILKTAYSACEAGNVPNGFAGKLLRVFMPSENKLGRLVKRHQGRSKGSAEVFKSGARIKISFSSSARSLDKVEVIGMREWTKEKIPSVYIPPKDLLSNAPGFLALYEKREIHFEEFYVDILKNATPPLLRGSMDKNRSELLEILQKEMDGKVKIKNEEFFLKKKQGNLEFSLLAEGFRKLGLLWTLIQNGTLTNGSILFWDEPEANLNPRIIRTLVSILLSLQRLDTQIFIATHDYVTLKEIDLQRKKDDQIIFHSLFRNKETKEIQCNSCDEFSGINPNAIFDTFSDLYDREITRTLGGTPK